MKTFLSVMMLISVLSRHAQNEDDKTNSINGEDRIFLHGGIKRTYKIYRPKNLPSNAPMVFLLHGQGSSNRWTYITGFNELSEKYGFLAVYPQSHKKEAMLDGALAKQAGMPQHLSQQTPLGVLTTHGGSQVVMLVLHPLQCQSS